MTGTPRQTRSQRATPPASITPPRYVDSGDARIAYQVAGEGSNAVFVLQPFWTEMGDVINDANSLIGQLASTHRVIVHDRRGTGASERHPARVSMDAMLEDAAAVLKNAGVESALVLGLGEAGPLAVRFAATWPERVTQLVLVDPALRPLKGPGSAMLLHTLRGKPRAGLRALARTLVDDDEAAAELGAQMASTVDGPTAARLYEAFLNADAVSVLEQVSVPALLTYGVFDRIVSEDEARNLQAKMPNARVSLVQGSAGGDQAEQEALVHIRGFMEESHSRPKQPERPRMTPQPSDSTDALRRPSRAKVHPTSAIAPVDYVPAGKVVRAHANPPPPPTMMPAGVVTQQMMTSHGATRPIMVAWGPPPDIPVEAVQANRKGIDQLLIGEIEEALNSFQRAIELAPHYEDALVNHRELLTRLVQRRVAEWQTKQAEDAMADAERRARQWAKRAGRRGAFGWLAKPFAKGA
jgi:pimeloyl-ACP methyl ester carboxylesterase